MENKPCETPKQPERLVRCVVRRSHAEHRNSWFGAQSEEADRNTGLSRRGGTVRYRRGEALEVERFGRNSPVDCFWKISRPEHRAFLKEKFGAHTEGRSPEA